MPSEQRREQQQGRNHQPSALMHGHVSNPQESSKRHDEHRCEDEGVGSDRATMEEEIGGRTKHRCGQEECESHALARGHQADPKPVS